MAEKEKKTFKEEMLSTEERETFKFVKERVLDLQEARKDHHYGVKLEGLWADADKDYVPHRLTGKGKKVIATDEEKGWRGQMVTLGSSEWQTDISQPNPFVKIQIALSILIDQNPSGVFSAAAKKFQATTELMKQLYERSWETAKSKQQLKLFVFNLAKYGWACARTYPLKIVRNVKVLKDYNEDDPEKSVWEEKEVVKYNDIMRENLDPRNVWIDDMAKPNNDRSVRDWTWRKVYNVDSLKEEFGNYKNIDYVQAGGNTEETLSTKKGSGKTYKDRNLVEVFFYENEEKDLFWVLAGGVPLVMEPLPISDAKGLKKLSLWQTYWNLRHAESPYGIGIYESIRFETAVLDRIRNMTLDQLTLSIYKMFFYQGTNSLTETGDIKITPGIGKQVLDPKNINWLEVPGPGIESWKGIEVMKQDVDTSSGITDPLSGQIVGKTAFETAQAKEAALKRLKNPLDNITEALDADGYLTVALIQILYSIPETYEVVEPDLIAAYLQEIESDPALYERNDAGTFVAKVYREFPLNLGEDEEGNLYETQDTQFFRTKPKFLNWEGVIKIKSQSVLVESKQVNKALELEMYNMLIPLLAQPPQIYEKIAKSICKLYDKDPKDILPPEWINPELLTQQQPLIVGGEGGSLGASATPGQSVSAPTLVSSTSPPERPDGVAQRIVSRISNGQI